MVSLAFKGIRVRRNGGKHEDHRFFMQSGRNISRLSSAFHLSRRTGRRLRDGRRAICAQSVRRLHTDRTKQINERNNFMKKRSLISILLIAMLCLLSSCQKAAGNEQTSGITNVNKQAPVLTTGNEQTLGTTNADRQTSALTTGNNNLDLPFEIDPDKLVAVSDSDIAKLRIGMTMSEVSKILKEKYSMPSSLIYPFIRSWKMSDGDFILVVFEIEGIETQEDFRIKFLSEEDKSKRIALINSAKMVCAIRRSNGESLIGETDD